MNLNELFARNSESVKNESKWTIVIVGHFCYYHIYHSVQTDLKNVMCGEPTYIQVRKKIKVYCFEAIKIQSLVCKHHREWLRGLAWGPFLSFAT